MAVAMRTVPPDGVARPPATAEEAAALLDRAADDRAEYLAAHRDPDVALSVDMLRAAAAIVRTGDVRSWVPSWKWQQYLDDRPCVCCADDIHLKCPVHGCDCSTAGPGNCRWHGQPRKAVLNAGA